MKWKNHWQRKNETSEVRLEMSHVPLCVEEVNH